jgi:hypothetical protein
MVGAGHATLTDTVNRRGDVEHNEDGTHKQIKMTAGAGATQAKVGGMLHVDLTEAETTSTTSEETMAAWTLPANTLNTVGQAIHVRAWGYFKNDGDTKRIRIYFGSTVVLDTSAAAIAGEGWHAEACVYLEAVGQQKAWMKGASQTYNFVNHVDGITEDETDAGGLEIKVTATNGTADAGCIIHKGFEVSFLGGVE